jgi:hypothetical protein
MGFENKGYGSIDSGDIYNLPGQDDLRLKEIEEVPDENAEKDIYNSVKNSFKENENNSELDKFGFVQVLQDYFNKVSDDKKEDLFRDANKFLVEYRKILDNIKNEKTALKEASRAFYKIIGKEIGGYNAETGKISFDLGKTKFVKVRDKKAPINAVKIEYDKNGRPVNPDKTPAVKKIKETSNIKTKHAKPGLKMPWRS